MTKAAQWWIDNLPWRWGLGGVFIGIGFVVLTVLTFEPEVGGPVQYGLYSLSAVVPFAVLGWAWGWQERCALRKVALRQSDGFAAPGEYHFLQAGKGAAFGLAFSVFVSVTSAAWMLFASIQGAAIQDGDAESATAIEMLSAFVVMAIAFGAIIGAGVGLVAGAGLRRRLRAAQSAALT